MQNRCFHPCAGHNISSSLPDMETNKIYKKYTIIIIFLTVYAGLITALIVWLFKDSNQGNIDKLESPAIIVLAIVISILTFTASSAVFSAIGKLKDNQALGMPEGSIRALIALSLITLFFILATQIYLKTSQGTVGSLQHVPEDQLKDLSLKDILSKTKVDSIKNKEYDSARKDTPKYLYYYDVESKLSVNTEASDMAKNIIASFISLIAAISGFYFGSASSRAAGASGTPDPPPTPDPPSPGKITPKSTIPGTGKKGTAMTFEWEVSPKGQSITVGITGDDAQPVADKSNPLKFTYTPNTVGTVTLKVFLTNSPDISQSNTIVISE